MLRFLLLSFSLLFAAPAYWTQKSIGTNPVGPFSLARVDTVIDRQIHDTADTLRKYTRDRIRDSLAALRTASTLQAAYSASTAPQIITSAAKGALTIRNGSGVDPAAVLTVQAGSGASVATISGTGEIAFAGRLVQGVSEVLDASKNLSVASATISGATANTLARFDASKYLVSYALLAPDIPALDASKITTGTLASGRMPAFTGDVTTAAGSTVTTLANSGVNPGGIGSATAIPVLSIDAKGRVTSSSSVTATPAWADITGKPAVIGTVTSVGLNAPALMTASGSPVTGSGNLSLTWNGASTNLVLADGTTIPSSTFLTGGPYLLASNPQWFGLMKSASGTLALEALLSGGIIKATAGTGVLALATAPDFPILNQNTTGSAARWTTPRTLTIGASAKTVDGTGNQSWSLAEIGAQAAGTYLTPSNVSGTAWQVATFTGTNTVGGHLGLDYVLSGSRVQTLNLGSSDAGGPASTRLNINQSTNAAGGGEIFLGAAGAAGDENSGKLLFSGARIIGRTATTDRVKLQVRNVAGTAWEDMLSIQGTSGGTARVDIPTGLLSMGGTTVVNSSRGGVLTALTVGSGTGFVRSTAGVYSASALTAGEIPALSYQPLENQRLSTTNSPTFAALTSGESHVGTWSGGATTARFGHKNFNASTGYGVIQTSGGALRFDAPTGSNVDTRINGMSRLLVNNDGIAIDGSARVSGLAGTGTRMVTTSSDGTLAAGTLTETVPQAFGADINLASVTSRTLYPTAAGLSITIPTSGVTLGQTFKLSTNAYSVTILCPGVTVYYAGTTYTSGSSITNSVMVDIVCLSATIWAIGIN